MALKKGTRNQLKSLRQHVAWLTHGSAETIASQEASSNACTRGREGLNDFTSALLFSTFCRIKSFFNFGSMPRAWLSTPIH